MRHALSVLFLVAQAGCTSGPPSEYAASSCATGENSYDCQVIRYQRASGPP